MSIKAREAFEERILKDNVTVNIVYLLGLSCSHLRISKVMKGVRIRLGRPAFSVVYIYKKKNMNVMYRQLSRVRCTTVKDTNAKLFVLRLSITGPIYHLQMYIFVSQCLSHNDTKVRLTVPYRMSSQAGSSHHPVASKAAVSGRTLHSFNPLPLSHFLNARLMPSGTASTSSTSGDPLLEQMTTELTGTNGLSSDEAARMPYSWAKTKAARNPADSVDLC